MIETRQKTYNKPKSEGCHCSDPKPDGSCCNLVCFERPNYFCGHLLTDTDLSKEQQYVIEKHKLYNRTLHGWGVVCGLRLTCGDPECCGLIVIDEGYAIDDCGNDLVVCEPLRFDVVSLLKEKGWIVGDPVYDPCLPEDDQKDCEYTQCFYVTVCYDEEPSDFTTPFVAGCRPTLTECEPTRIREGVRFDVLNKLPEEHSWLKDLIERFKACFSIFTTGPFFRTLNETNKRGVLERICSNPDTIEGSEFDNLNTLFCELRGFLLLYLKKHPDHYNCKLSDEIRLNTLPDSSTTGFGQKVKDAFSKLLGLAFRHAISCALGELVPRCTGPRYAGCVVLGTVEVRGGCVTHVCNCPRKYVWSFANFFQVLLATLVNSVACEEKEEPAAQTGGGNNTVGTVGAVPSTTPPRGVGDEEEEHERHVCCAEFDASCEQILRLINISPKFLQYAGTETVRAFASMSKSFMSSFNFTDASMFSPSMLVGIQQKDLSRAVNLLGIQDVRMRDVSVAPASVHPFEQIARLGLMRMGATDTALVIEHDKEVVVNAYALPSWVHTEISTEQKTPPGKGGRDAATAKPATSQTQDAPTVEARLTKLEEQLREFIRTSAASEGRAQSRIREILDSLPETPETEAEAKKKRSLKGRGLPGTPEARRAPASKGKRAAESKEARKGEEAPKGEEGKNG